MPKSKENSTKLQICKVDIVGFLIYIRHTGKQSLSLDFYGLFSKAKINWIFLKTTQIFEALHILKCAPNLSTLCQVTIKQSKEEVTQ